MKLLSFSISNYKSFYTEQSVDFDASGNNVDAFFGPNGSGKSNLYEAMAFYKRFIRNSTSFQANILPSPYAYNIEAENQPTKLSAVMKTKKSVMDYSFSLLDGNITNEVLKRRAIGKKGTFETIFSRASIDKKRYEEFGFSSALLKATRSDALVLTKAWENNNRYALEVFDWLDHFRFVSGDQGIGMTAKHALEDTDFRTKVLDFVRRADLSIQDISVSQMSLPDEVIAQLAFTKAAKLKLDRTTYDIVTTHMVYDKNGKIVRTKTMPMNGVESRGTSRIFELAFAIIDTLEKGNVLYIDEFETYLHPKECAFIISLFTSKDNTKNAQLILNTHNTQLLDILGRNSVHLVGKNNREESIVARISKEVRVDDKSLEKKYTKGVFGALPNIQW